MFAFIWYLSLVPLSEAEGSKGTSLPRESFAWFKIELQYHTIQSCGSVCHSEQSEESTEKNWIPLKRISPFSRNDIVRRLASMQS